MEWESPIGFVDYLPFYYLRTFVRTKVRGKKVLLSFSEVVSVHMSSFSRQKHIPAVRSVLGVPVYFRSNGFSASFRESGLSARFV